MYLTIRSDRVTDERIRALLEAGAYLDYDRARRALQADPRGGRGVSQDAVLAQLLAIRAEVDAAIALVSGGSDEGCSHPADERFDLTEMGGPIRYLCRACGQEITIEEEEDHEGA